MAFSGIALIILLVYAMLPFDDHEIDEMAERQKPSLFQTIEDIQQICIQDVVSKAQKMAAAENDIHRKKADKEDCNRHLYGIDKAYRIPSEDKTIQITLAKFEAFAQAIGRSLLQSLKLRIPDMRAKVIPSGSAFYGTKVNGLDDVDFIIVLENYIQSLDIDNKMYGMFPLAKLSQVAEDMQQMFDFTSMFEFIKVNGHGTAFGYHITWATKHNCKNSVNVDITIAFENRVITLISQLTALRHSYVFKNILKMVPETEPVVMVGNSVTSSVVDKYMYNITDGISPNIKRAYRLMKVLFDKLLPTVLCIPSYEKSIHEIHQGKLISSHYLKTILFNEVSIHPRKTDWNNLYVRLSSMVKMAHKIPFGYIDELSKFERELKIADDIYRDLKPIKGNHKEDVLRLLNITRTNLHYHIYRIALTRAVRRPVLSIVVWPLQDYNLVLNYISQSVNRTKTVSQLATLSGNLWFTILSQMDVSDAETLFGALFTKYKGFANFIINTSSLINYTLYLESKDALTMPAGKPQWFDFVTLQKLKATDLSWERENIDKDIDFLHMILNTEMKDKNVTEPAEHACKDAIYIRCKGKMHFAGYTEHILLDLQFLGMSCLVYDFREEKHNSKLPNNPIINFITTYKRTLCREMPGADLTKVSRKWLRVVWGLYLGEAINYEEFQSVLPYLGLPANQTDHGLSAIVKYLTSVQWYSSIRLTAQHHFFYDIVCTTEQLEVSDFWKCLSDIMCGRVIDVYVSGYFTREVYTKAGFDMKAADKLSLQLFMLLKQDPEELERFIDYLSCPEPSSLTSFAQFYGLSKPSTIHKVLPLITNLSSMYRWEESMIEVQILVQHDFHGASDMSLVWTRPTMYFILQQLRLVHQQSDM